ncbi:MAG: WD40 repeat domain-containing protein [Fimbriimonadales bacterium]
MLIAAALVTVLGASGKPMISVSLLSKMEGLHALAFAPSPTGSKVAATLENNDVRIIDAASRRTLRTLTGHPQPPYAVAWSKDGTFIATGDESARIIIWNALTGERMKTIIGHIRGIQCLSFNTPRTLLASTGKDDVLNVWNVSTGKKVAEILGKGQNLYSGCFDPKLDNLLMVGTLAGGAKTYRMTNDGAHVMNFLNFANPSGQAHGVLDCNWSPDGTKAVTAANDDLAVLWDMKSFKKLGTFRGHGDWVLRAEFSPNGKLVATSSSDRTVRVWDASTFESVATLENEGAVGSPLCFTSDGKFLLTTGVDDNLEVYGVSPSQGSASDSSRKPAKRRRRH